MSGGSLVSESRTSPQSHGLRLRPRDYCELSYLQSHLIWLSFRLSLDLSLPAVGAHGGGPRTLLNYRIYLNCSTSSLSIDKVKK